MRVADYVMQRLAGEGVRHVFTVTGRGTLFLTDALARQTAVQGVFVHHEQAAAFGAVGYAQVNERLGACLVSTGCAATNALTGVLCAWQDGVPCVFVSGQNTLAETTRHSGRPLRTYGQQEADIVSIVGSITKYAVMLDDATRVAYEMDRALHLAGSGRKGPVWIDIPLDVQSMHVDEDALERFVPPTPSLDDAPAGDVGDVAAMLRGAERPVLLVGAGVRWANAVPALERFLEKHPMPVTFSASGVDAYGSARALSVGSVGAMGCSRAGAFAVQNADLVVVVGHRLNTLTTGTERHKFARGAKVVAVDIDPIEHTKGNVTLERVVAADARRFFEALTHKEGLGAKPAWLAKCARWKRTFPKVEAQFRSPGRVDLYELAECLSSTMAPDTIFVSDSGFAEVILPPNIDFGPQMRCIHPAQQGSMGFALPAAVGATFASDAPVVAAIGDGSIMMNLQELQTVRHLNARVKVLVLNNNVYGIIRRRQTDLFRSRTIGTDPANGVSCPNFEAIAAAFGLPFVRIDGRASLAEKLGDVLAREGPVLCEIMTREDQQYIEMATARNAQGRFVRRPLEDQAPFLDRDVFRAEMIVEPIDQ